MARGKFIDLGDAPPKFTEPEGVEARPKKYYPKAYVRKKVKGVTKVGQRVRLSVDAKVVAMRESEADAPEVELELRRLAVEDDDA